MISPEKNINYSRNLMTEATKYRLEQELTLVLEKAAQSKLDIGDAAGRESDWHDNPAFELANQEYDLFCLQAALIRKKLENAAIISPRSQTENVDLGNNVVIQYEGEQPETITVLGPDDARQQVGWISYLSPLGSQLLHHSVGDVVNFSVQKGIIHRVRILSIHPWMFG